MSKKVMVKKLVILFLAVLTAALFAGCSNKISSVMPTEDPLAMDESTLVADAVGDYSDISLPLDMEYLNDKSMAIRTDSFQGGILQYSGRVELSSLKDFVVVSMQNNKWKLVGEAQYENILLAFIKPNKTCMVVMTEGIGGSLGKTYVTLYITYDINAGNRLTPFGEPMK